MRLSNFHCAAAVTVVAFFSTLAMFKTPNVSAQTVQVTITDSSMSPKTIQTTKGQPVHIEIVNKGKKIHNFVVPRFYVFSPNINPGGNASVQFTPDKTGVFQYYSDKKGVPEPGIQGVLHVY